MDFNKKLQSLRKSRNLTQEQLAEKLFVSRTAVSKWESGKGYPNIDTLKDISEFFTVSVDELISDGLSVSVVNGEKENKRGKLCSAIFSITDLFFMLFIFLPFYGVKSGDSVRAAWLADYVCVSSYLKPLYFVLLSTVSAFGATETIILMLKGNISRRTSVCSLILHSCSLFVFALSGQTYVTACLFAFFIIKAFAFSAGKKNA